MALFLWPIFSTTTKALKIILINLLIFPKKTCFKKQSTKNSKISTSTDKVIIHNRSSFSPEHIAEAEKLELEKEIQSYWPYPNKYKKEKKQTA